MTAPETIQKPVNNGDGSAKSPVDVFQNREEEIFSATCDKTSRNFQIF